MQYTRTLKRKKAILEAGFELVECWEHDFHEKPIYLKKKNENLSTRHRVRFRGVAGREQTSAADERPTFWKRERASIGVVGGHSE